ncbi:MmcQ/YjbR family DNA-binding protein [Actinosynnema sp. NPDC023587]|uniref:MmcQ/YjbR family DNA-binding protein n=1 Tax=Actinosynnema sp. NPDC023587 TaxID=3154695 RepID=UPI003405D047
MAEYPDVPEEILARVRTRCLALPEAAEEQAWRGTRWRVGQRPFAHLLEIDRGKPASYAEASGLDAGSVLTFRAGGPELVALSVAPLPFFKPRWSATAIGLVLDAGTDWDEVGELLVESFCASAPKRLADRVVRPA